MRKESAHAGILGKLGAGMRRILSSLGLGSKSFPGSELYWEARYSEGGNSGAGSYERLAEFKAEVINAFVAEQGITSVIELGCGDGNQLGLARYPEYQGLDVSEAALARCRSRFADDRTKTFQSMDDYGGETADLVLSLDVIYHLVEDAVFERYMARLLAAGLRFAIIYSSDTDEVEYSGKHVRHRNFSRWVERNAPTWKLIRHVPNRHPAKADPGGSFADFYIYEKSAGE